MRLTAKVSLPWTIQAKNNSLEHRKLKGVM